MSAITLEKTASVENLATSNQARGKQLATMLLMLLVVAILVAFWGLLTNPILTIVAGLATGIAVPTMIISYLING
ncbi:hypothetical protein [Mobiluncus mulieris]|uniref:Uncharacterized protein n=1 Tax=Mobiluncus mulieris TaxID=2052 RepID=A0ABD4TSR5_9ACTO|nr:hypothetical protein [Mobiluncus mulieris]MCU9967941.1 hypothetical protein [Mobiluncus mulieris]MCU9973333.1 hypothetical protein [Mobiluncus mulieris]MCU9974989.1 hypothetical protein [Mobiluncus mulieris]NMX01290.1 hypothetical protein [Mobiluncus mulieris]NMX18744.1 hypothetical protein [Mobiluncus mulieris]